MVHSKPPSYRPSQLLPWLGGGVLILGLILIALSWPHWGVTSSLQHTVLSCTPTTFLNEESIVPTAAPEGISVGNMITGMVPAVSGEKTFVFPERERFRLGVSIPPDVALGTPYLSKLGVRWVMDWRSREPPILPPDVEYVQVVRMMGGVLSPSAITLTLVAGKNPGSTWLMGNEGDVRWQDNVTPEVYARLYHEAYTAIKAGDPTAIVVAGGIAQPTPLRLRYLDLILASYQAQFGKVLPAQAWHIHNYMLREERDSWGVDIPPGIPDETGILYQVDDSGNLEAFRAQIVNFRRWMMERGYGNLPLIVSEFGIPMPPQYGFPLERVTGFLQETWRYFLTATDPDLGDPSDGGRLVQKWCWFSMAAQDYPTGDLVNWTTQTWTPLGQVWISYLEE
ncbi:MAG: hypothetical protein JXA33_02020 [Anaerolineae bacterium]|nr:hypothetical protein [Anaerolineae bacterium]